MCAIDARDPDGNLLQKLSGPATRRHRRAAAPTSATVLLEQADGSA
jgi:hypothetical protein